MSDDTGFVGRVFICGPTIYEYDGVLFESQRTGCPYWPTRWPSCKPYERLSARIRTALDRFLALTDEQRAQYVWQGPEEGR